MLSKRTSLDNPPLRPPRIIRRKRGLCITCGYDLRNVKHEVCPECGAQLESNASIIPVQ